jgi:hypothetical protein
VDEACGHTEADYGEKVNGDDGPVDCCHMRVLGGFLEGCLRTPKPSIKTLGVLLADLFGE